MPGTRPPELPHGPGFHLISDVVAIEPATDTVRCQLNLDELTILDLADHFRDKPRMPATLQVEMARQTLTGIANACPEAKTLWPRIISLRQIRFPGRMSPSKARATCCLFSLEDADAATFTIKVISDDGERLASEGTLEFVLVETTIPQPPSGFKFIHRQIGLDTESRTIQATYNYTGKEILDLSKLVYLPETLVIEAMVQGAIQIGQGNPAYANKLFWFTGIESAEFLEPIPRRGMLDLLATVEIEERSGRALCQALVAGKLAARTTITFAITRGKATT